MFWLNRLLCLRYQGPNQEGRTRPRPRRPFRPYLECLEGRLTPAMLFVTTHADVVNPHDGVLSLREAITLANAATHADTIVLGTGTYKIAIVGADEDGNATGDFDIAQDMTIAGQGAGITTVDGAGLDRIFDLLGPISVTFADLSLRHGAVQDAGGAIQALTANFQVVDCTLSDNSSVEGGAINADDGNVSLIGSTVSRNVAEDNGGGIRLGGGLRIGSGALTLSQSTVQRNLADGDGGGIYDHGAATLTGSTVGDNQSGTSGGGIAATTVTLTNSTVRDNITGGLGGGISCSAAANLTGCAVSDNQAATFGGGIATAGTATLKRTTVSGNSAGNDCGGIDALTAILTNTTVSDNLAANGAGVDANTVTLTGSTVNDNHAVQDGGGIDANIATLTACTVSGNSAGQSGGGVYGILATLTNTTVSRNSSGGNGAGIDGANSISLSDSTVSGNHAIGNGGGIFAPGSLSLVASTVSGNTAIGATGNGGVHAYNADVVNCTISGNSAAGFGGGIFMSGISILLFDTIAVNSAGNGGGICRATNGATQFVQDSIIALNLVTFGGAAPDVFGGVLSEGNNLIGILDSAGNSSFTNGVKGDQVGSVSNPLLPGLSALGFHGGPTETFALLANSKALNAGDNVPLSTLEVAVGAGDTTFNPGRGSQLCRGHGAPPGPRVGASGRREQHHPHDNRPAWL